MGSRLWGVAAYARCARAAASGRHARLDRPRAARPRNRWLPAQLRSGLRRVLSVRSHDAAVVRRSRMSEALIRVPSRAGLVHQPHAACSPLAAAGRVSPPFWRRIRQCSMIAGMAPYWSFGAQGGARLGAGSGLRRRMCPRRCARAFHEFHPAGRAEAARADYFTIRSALQARLLCSRLPCRRQFLAHWCPTQRQLGRLRQYCGAEICVSWGRTAALPGS